MVQPDPERTTGPQGTGAAKEAWSRGSCIWRSLSSTPRIAFLGFTPKLVNLHLGGKGKGTFVIYNSMSRKSNEAV